jgi:uncharacterized protein YrrD
MLIKSKTLKGYALAATDGDIGTVEEFYFDDHHWTIRYLVADTVKWIKNHTVLISPHALESIDDFNHRILLNISKRAVELSPTWDTDLPISQQDQTTYYGYYGYPLYWFGAYPWGDSPGFQKKSGSFDVDKNKKWDPNLRSTRAIAGYRVEAADGEMGHVKDFIIDDQTWTIRYLEVETGSWLNRKRVLVETTSFKDIFWAESMILTTLTQQEIRNAPACSDQTLLDRSDDPPVHFADSNALAKEMRFRHQHRTGP